MLRQNSPEIVSESIISPNRKKDNVLHVCASNHRHVLFAEICLESAVPPDIIGEAVNQVNSSGLTPLDCCQDQEITLKIMKFIPHFNIHRVDKKGNNVLAIYGKKNFRECVEKIIFKYGDDNFLRYMFLQQNNHGNNPLMSCVLKNQSDVLNLMLGVLLTMAHNEENQNFICGNHRTIINQPPESSQVCYLLSNRPVLCGIC